MSTSKRVKRAIIEDGMSVRWLGEYGPDIGFVAQTLVDDGTGSEQLLTFSKQPDKGHPVVASVQDLHFDDCPKPATTGRPIPADLEDALLHTKFPEGAQFDTVKALIGAAVLAQCQSK